MHQGYDLIGDIHGCGLTLIDLLEQMGYSKRNGVYQHPKRKVVFHRSRSDSGWIRPTGTFFTRSLSLLKRF